MCSSSFLIVSHMCLKFYLKIFIFSLATILLKTKSLGTKMPSYIFLPLHFKTTTSFLLVQVYHCKKKNSFEEKCYVQSEQYKMCIQYIILRYCYYSYERFLCIIACNRSLQFLPYHKYASFQIAWLKPLSFSFFRFQREFLKT